MRTPLFAFALPTLLLVAPAAAQEIPKQIGGIHFLDDLDAALALSAKDGKPVLAYFTFET